MATQQSSGAVKKLGITTLVVMNIVAVVSLRGLPAEAEYGLSSIFYYVFAAIFFLIPVSLVAAELATGWPEKAACSAGWARLSGRNGRFWRCLCCGLR